MKFLLDHNLSFRYAKVLDALSQQEDIRVFHLTERFAADTDDAVWIEALAEEGNWCIVSQDVFRKNDLEKEALRRCGLTVFSLERNWNHQPFWVKATQLVRWWPIIIKQANLIQGGAAFRVPWRFTNQGRLEQIRL